MFRTTKVAASRFWPRYLVWMALAAVLLIAACTVSPRSDDPRAAGIRYSFGGAASREFDVSLARVKAATTAALAAHHLRLEALGILPSGESLRARGPRATVLVELEREGRARTRMRVTARGKEGIDRRLETDLIIDVADNLKAATKR
ncbi:MAG: hypothetical protein OEW21_19645 [Betaproteobacteria bacterium]|nr:hypothetical protein [Betaproteobacteria bacterium]